MKNLITCGISLLIFLLCFSCVKEENILTEEESEVIMQEGDIKLLTGMVRDTSGASIPQASIKIVFDDLELETESDENGMWNLKVPGSLTEGFVVANKIEYSKSIQRLIITEDNRTEDLYLVDELSNNDSDLSLRLENLKTVQGRLVDENTNPISDVNIFVLSVMNFSNETVSNGFAYTRGDGSFELIYENGDFNATTLHALISNGCSDVYSKNLEVENLMEDLGDIEISYDEFTIFQTSVESDGSSCYNNESVLAYYWALESAFQPIIYDQPLGDISLEYCPKDIGAFYVGVENEDNSHFNGQFFTPEETLESYQFDICTPNPGNFVELIVNGKGILYEDNLSLIGPGKIAYQNPEIQLLFSVRTWAIFTPLGSEKPAYQIGELQSLAILGDLEIVFNTLENEAPSFNYVNIVQDDENFFAGIAQTRLLATDGSPADVAIRFRVAR